MEAPRSKATQRKTTVCRGVTPGKLGPVLARDLASPSPQAHPLDLESTSRYVCGQGADAYVGFMGDES